MPRKLSKSVLIFSSANCFVESTSSTVAGSLALKRSVCRPDPTFRAPDEGPFFEAMLAAVESKYVQV